MGKLGAHRRRHGPAIALVPPKPIKPVGTKLHSD